MKDILFKKLKILGGITTRKYMYGAIIRDLFHEGKLSFLSGRYYDNFKAQYYNLQEDLKKNDTWSTYEDCVDVTLSVSESDLIKIKVVIWNGKLVDGERTNQKWEAELSDFKMDDLVKFQSTIEYNFQCYLEDLYEQEQETKRKLRIKQLEEETLNSLEPVNT